MSNVKTTVSFDMRAPEFGAPTKELYGAALDMAQFADEIGVNAINLMEHHASEDGYLPQPFVLGGGIAARTKNLRIMLGAVILPLHDPVQLAEKIAVLDLMSNGRLSVIFGAGYVKAEFDAFKVSLHDRGKLLDQGIDLILRALSGERFEANGRPVFIRPLPVQDPRDIVIGGGGVLASAKRAAKFDIGFCPVQPSMLPVYAEECARLGRKPRYMAGSSPGVPGVIHLSEDPDRSWAILEKHALHVVSEYAKWAAQEENSNSPFKSLLENPAGLRHCGMYAVWTPDELVSNIGKLDQYSGFGFQPLLGGLDPKEGWKSLELLKKTMPRLQAAKSA